MIFLISCSQHAILDSRFVTVVESTFSFWTHMDLGLWLAQGLNWGGSHRISDPAPFIWDPLPLITDPVPHSWDPAAFIWDPPLCWEESKHQTLFKCHRSPTECLECSKTPGQRSGAPPVLSALWAPASALQASPVGIHRLLLSILTTGLA